MKISIVKLSEVKKDNEVFRLDSDYWASAYAEYKEYISNKFEISFLNKSDIKFGTTPSGAEFETQGILFVRSSDFMSGFIDTEKSVYISQQNHEKQISSKIINNDILIAAVGATIGQVAIFKSNKEANTNQNIARVRIKDKKIIPEFVMIFMLTKYGQTQLGSFSTGNAQPYLNTSNIANIFCPILDNNFQSLVEKLVVKAHGLREEGKESYKQAEGELLQELGFIDFEPKSTLTFTKSFKEVMAEKRVDAEYFQPKYDEIIKKIKSYPHGSKPLGEIADIRKSIEVGSDAYIENENNNVPYIRVSNLSKNGIENKNCKYITQELYNENQILQPKKGEILLSKDGTIGIAYTVKESYNFLVSSGILMLSIKEESNDYINECLTLLLNSILIQEQANRESGGALIEHWLMNSIEKTYIPLLPSNIQNSIANKVQNSFTCQEQAKKLLEIAQIAVETAIEQTETQATEYIKTELTKINITL